MAGQDPHKIAMKAYNKGDLATAERLYTRLTRQAPGDFNALHMLGLIRARQGRFAEAEGLIARALLHGRSAEAFSNHGNVLSELGRHEEAIRQLTQATLLNPRSPENHFNLANALVKTENLVAAARAFASAISLKPDFAEALENAAEVWRDLGRAGDAVALLKRAVALRPDDADLLIRLGVALQEIGEIEESKRVMASALERDPSATAAYYHLARASKVDPQDGLLARMEAQLRYREALSDKARAMLDFGLAKAYDDVGRYEEAFELLAEANRLVRAEMRHDEAAAIARFERLRTSFTAELLQQCEGFGYSSETPIFIVGFPRSGTTLTEQILASHPAVHGAGESSLLFSIVSSSIVRIDNGDGTALNFPESLALLPKDRFRAAGERYVRDIREGAPDALRITDKLPANFMFMGFIRLILPQPRSSTSSAMRSPPACRAFSSASAKTTFPTRMSLANWAATTECIST